MSSPEKVADLLVGEKHQEKCAPLPEEEFKASAVNVRLGTSEDARAVLPHRRRVNNAQARGEDAVYVCERCQEALAPAPPRMC